MSRVSRRWIAGAAALLTLWSVGSAAADDPLDPALESQLAKLVQQAQQQPEVALQALKQLRDQHNSLSPRRPGCVMPKRKSDWPRATRPVSARLPMNWHTSPACRRRPCC